MDIDRPHFRSTSSGSSTAATTSELFICFTSRLSSSSSSSMKLSKSILSPARAARDGGGPTSLSSSHSRRLRSNGSLKGGQASPFFTTTGKKRGCAFENPEPSSPKVTCIGQVRVKTKKKVKQTRSLSKRRTSTAGEVSFRKIEQPTTDGDEKSQQQQQRYSNASAHYQPQQECQPHRNQRWVHLPISICEALREFSCLLPCKSSCFSTNERDKSEKHNGSNENGCGAVFARWLVSVNDGEGGKRREIELVVGGGDEEEQEQEQEDDEEERRVSMRTSRRHVFEDIEVKDDRIEMKGQSLEREEEAAAAARVSICIPPKNALLLMRCRSDPMKMAALANRSTSNNQDQPIFEEQNVAAAAPSHDDDDDDDDDGGKDEIFEQQIAETTEITTQVEDKLEIQGDLEVGQQLEEEELEIISSDEMVDEMIEETELQCHDEESPAVEPVCCGGYEEEEESNMSSFEDLLEQENAEEYEDCCPIQDEEQIEEDTTHLSPPTQSDEEGESPLLLQESAAAMDTIPEDSTVGPIQDPDFFINNDEENQKTAPPPPETTSGDDEEEDELPEEGEEHLRVVAKPEENQQKMSEVKKEEEKEKEKERERAREREKERPLLPECLLLMMCEPKLSMEVSTETWVCSTDFTRRLPERPRRAAKTAKSGGGGEHETLKRRLSIDSKTKPIIEKSELQQPPRSSCSLPMAAASMASMIEQKLVNAVAYEPFVLTRCKSEPMRTAAVKLMTESCFWKNAVRKMEPHRCATTGVGAAAGVGF